MPDLKGVRKASENLRDVSIVTPLNLNERLSEKLNARIFFKREDLQKVRSFKIRGAFNKIKSLNLENTQGGKKIICASAGNHAQGVAYSCNKLKILNFSSFECEVFIEIIAKIQYVKTKSDITASPTSCSIILENRIANRAIIKNFSSLLPINNFNLEK